MPRYTCTTAHVLSSTTKAALAAAITQTNRAVIGSPDHYVHVALHEMAEDNLYTGGKPSQSFIVVASIRAGRTDETKTRLAQEISRACSAATQIPEAQIMVSIKETPARFVSEGGQIMPEPGEEDE